jgi:hypothetical protein
LGCWGAAAWLKVLNGQMGFVGQCPGSKPAWFMAPKIISSDRWRKMCHWWAAIIQRSWRRSLTARFQWPVLSLGLV